MNIETIIEKLRKLIAHEQSARSIGNLHEAEAFASKIQSMLDEYKLSMDEIAYSQREVDEPIDWEPVTADEIDHTETYGTKRLKTHWQQQIANAIAKANSCTLVNSTGNKGKIFFVGRTTDRQLCKMLYCYLVALGEELCEKAAKEDVDDQYHKFCDSKGYHYNEVPKWEAVAFRGWMKDWRKSWRRGFSDAIAARLKEAHAETEVKAAGTCALVHMKKDALDVKEFLQHKVHQGTGNGVSGSNIDGYARGKSTGGAVALTPNRFAPKPSGKVVGLLGR